MKKYNENEIKERKDYPDTLSLVAFHKQYLSHLNSISINTFRNHLEASVYPFLKRVQAGKGKKISVRFNKRKVAQQLRDFMER